MLDNNIDSEFVSTDELVNRSDRAVNETMPELLDHMDSLFKRDLQNEKAIRGEDIPDAREDILDANALITVIADEVVDQRVPLLERHLQQLFNGADLATKVDPFRLLEWQGLTKELFSISFEMLIHDHIANQFPQYPVGVESTSDIPGVESDDNPDSVIDALESLDG